MVPALPRRSGFDYGASRLSCIRTAFVRPQARRPGTSRGHDDRSVTRHRTRRRAHRRDRLRRSRPADAAHQRRGRRLLGLPVQVRPRRATPRADDIVLERDGAKVLIDHGVARLSGRLGDRFRRRSDRRVVPDQQPERHRLLRLRHQLLDLTLAALAVRLNRQSRLGWPDLSIASD